MESLILNSNSIRTCSFNYSNTNTLFFEVTREEEKITNFTVPNEQLYFAQKYLEIINSHINTISTLTCDFQHNNSNNCSEIIEQFSNQSAEMRRRMIKEFSYLNDSEIRMFLKLDEEINSKFKKRIAQTLFSYNYSSALSQNLELLHNDAAILAENHLDSIVDLGKLINPLKKRAKYVEIGQEKQAQTTSIASQTTRDKATQTTAKFDLGNIDLKNLTDAQRMELASKEHITPPPNYVFPHTVQNNANGDKRKASHAMLKKYDWLVFSTVSRKEGLWCLPCALMFNGHNTPKHFKKIVKPNLVLRKIEDYSNLTGANGKLERHSKNVSHEYAVKGIENLKKEASSESGTLRSFALQKSLEKCGYGLKIIVETCYLLAKRNISFRGKNDNSSDLINKLKEKEVDSNNIGNFLEILNHIADIDSKFKEFILGSDQNKTYTSSQSQKGIIKLLRCNILKKIKTLIDISGVYGLVFDDTTCVSGKQVMSIIIRYL